MKPDRNDVIEQIKPCPFCGSKAEVCDGVETTPEEGAHFIQCTSPACAASSKLMWSNKEDCRPLLIEAWNTRADEPSSEDDIRAVGEALEIAGEFNLECEVVLFALYEMRRNPKLTIEQALSYGVGEWVK